MPHNSQWMIAFPVASVVIIAATIFIARTAWVRIAAISLLAIPVLILVETQFREISDNKLQNVYLFVGALLLLELPMGLLLFAAAYSLRFERGITEPKNKKD